MTVDRAVMAFAGLVILVSLALAHLASPYWLWLTAFVGLNLIQASFTGLCPAAMVFKRLGVRTGEAFTLVARPAFKRLHGRFYAN
jgi:Protein of unknown function (DUF2892)